MNPLLAHATRRAALAALGLAALSAAIFGLFDMTPGRASDELRLEGSLSAAAADQRDAESQRSFAVRYLDWARGAIVGNLGESKAYGRPVTTLVRERLMNTLVVATPALVLTWSISLPLGLWAALHAGRWGDRALMAATSWLMAIPEILLAFLLLWVVVRLGIWRPATSAILELGDASAAVTRSDWLSLLPPLFLTFVTSAPTVARTVRLSALAVLDEPFFRALRARGVAAAPRLALHVVKGASAPLLTLLSSSVTLAIGGALVAEVVFSWPGAGALLYRATLARDEPLVVGTVMTTAVFLVLVNSCGELLAERTDPRATPR